jgi:hypothetical protein
MSEWNYTKCSKPFDSEADALEYMKSKDLAGYVLKRETGYSAVCPTYPDGFYPDAVLVSEIDNSKAELNKAQKSLPVSNCC